MNKQRHVEKEDSEERKLAASIEEMVQGPLRKTPAEAVVPGDY